MASGDARRAVAAGTVNGRWHRRSAHSAQYHRRHHHRAGAAPADGAPHEWLIDARQPVAPERLEFAPFPREASLGIDIDSSHNLQDWTPLVRDASVVMLGKGDDAVDVRVVKLAGSPARYYRVRVSRGDAPWGTSATTVTLSGNVEDATSKDVAKRRWFVVAPTDTRSSGQGVDYDYRLPAALPVSALRVKLGKSDSVARFDAIAVEGEMSGEQLGTLVVTPVPTPRRRRRCPCPPRDVTCCACIRRRRCAKRRSFPSVGDRTALSFCPRTGPLPPARRQPLGAAAGMAHRRRHDRVAHRWRPGLASRACDGRRGQGTGGPEGR